MKKYYPDFLGLSIIAFVTIAVIFKFQTLPDVIPMHWNVKGAVDSRADKIWIFTGCFISLIVYALLTIIFTYAYKPFSNEHNSMDTETFNKLRERGYVFLGAAKIMLMLMPLLFTVSSAFIYPSSASLPFSVFGTIVCIASALFLLLKFMQNQAAQKGEVGSPSESVFKYLGAYDPTDPNVFVDRKIGMGTTVNLATRGGKIFIVVGVGIPFLFLFCLGVYLLLK